MIPGLLAVALAGSLRMEDLTPCSGDELVPGTVVTVHYEGRLEDGTVFDSSYARDTPIEVPIGKGVVIEGWDIGMQGMSVGCKRRLIIPPELGYGARSVGPIPANATLTFDVELLATKAGRPPAPVRPIDPPSLETTESGLRVHDIVVGSGPQPVTGDTAVVEYTLWLADGKRIDSSYDRRQPFQYEVGMGRVIPGWEEAVMGMKVGGRRHFRVPWELGYGRRGRPPTIPAKAELVFEVELVEVRSRK